MNETSWVVELTNLAATTELARQLSSSLKAGDLITLGGSYGAGKSTFARALIRHMSDEPSLEVPSPSFTLIQSYETIHGSIVHADLYRLNSRAELDEIGWEDIAQDAIVLVEWAEKIDTPLADNRLDITFILDEDKPDQRVAVLTGYGNWSARLGMMKAIDRLLLRAGWHDAVRHYMQGDASARAYERLELKTETGSKTAILMISPPRPDGPVIRGGKTYSQIARLAESVHAFAAMTAGLRQYGFSAPAIYAQDLDKGLLLIEDFGAEPVVKDGKPIEERLMVACETLARLHSTPVSDVIPWQSDEPPYKVPRYALEAMLAETELLLDWYLPHLGHTALPASARIAFQDRWTRALEDIFVGHQTWVLRDYHSPNLIWLPERQGTARMGLLDYQDCVMGHPSYDLVSLLQDARVTVPQDMELRLLSHYLRLRQHIDASFDKVAFARAYSLMGAQRATKILGIFARLNKRDGKPHYLAHLPRVENALLRCLAHPAMRDMKLWYKNHLPHLFPAAE